MRSLAILLWCCALPLVGCATSSTSNTARTASEQLLISQAVDDSLSRVDFGTFAGHNVFVEEKYMDSVDKNYIIGSIRHRLMMQGVRIVDKKEDSDISMEIRSGGVGTDSEKMFVGVPEVTIPGMVSIPELRMVTKESQQAAAKLGIVAYHTQSGQILGDGGVSLAQSNSNNWFILGVGPYENGTLKEEIDDSNLISAQTRDVEIPKQVAFQSSRPPGTEFSSGESGSIRFASEHNTQY